MATKTYESRGYPFNTYVPAYQDGYDHHLKHSGNHYVVETKTFESNRALGAGYTEFVGSPSKAELLKEFVHSPTMSGSIKYTPKNHYADETNYGLNYENSSSSISPNKHTRGYFSEEPIRTHSGSSYVRTSNISGPNKAWQAAGPPTTHHPLTTSTDNINEALGLLEDSRRKGVFNDPSTHDPQRRYALPAFVAKRKDTRNKFTNT